ncbi:Hypothetical predicted protein, partial [Olea europaea subsp. europaea]
MGQMEAVRRGQVLVVVDLLRNEQVGQALELVQRVDEGGFKYRHLEERVLVEFLQGAQQEQLFPAAVLEGFLRAVPASRRLHSPLVVVHFRQT